MHYRYTFDENIFEKIDTPDKAWLLGLIFSDGNVDQRCRILTFHIHKKDEDIFHKILSIFDGNNTIYTDKRGYLYMRFCSKKMCDDLIKLGCMPAKSKIIEFPNYLDDVLIPHFIRGIFDGDGCLSKTGQISIVGTESLCTSISIILNSLNIENKCVKHKQSNFAFYVLVSKHIEAKKFLEYIYNNSDEKIRMNRKYAYFQELLPILVKEKYKLSNDEVRTIRRLYDDGMRICDIHRMFPNMCNSSIDHIAKRQRHKKLI